MRWAVVLVVVLVVPAACGSATSRVGSLPPIATTTSTTSTTVPSSPVSALPSPQDPLAARLADTTDVPAGFLGGGLDEGLVNAGGTDHVSRKWTRPLVGGGEDTISLFVTEFASATKAINFNASAALEYQSGPLTRSEAIAGIPRSMAYEYGTYPRPSATGAPDASAPPAHQRQATAWFTVGAVAVGVYVVDSTEDPFGVAESLAQAQYRRLSS